MKKQCFLFSGLLMAFFYASTIFADEELHSSAQADYQPVNILRAKSEYYREHGFEVLPEFVENSTIGPGQFVAIVNTTIRKGRALTINPGTTIWFEPQCRLVVEGSLQAAATDIETIRLNYLPSSMRYIKIAVADSLWNGIALEPGGNLFLNRIVLGNAVAGITAVGGLEGVDISCIDMSDNVATPVIIDGKTVEVSDPSCISVADLQSARTPGVDSSSHQPGAQRFKPALRIGSCLVAVSGIGIATYGAWLYGKYGKLYENSTDRSRYTPQDIDLYRKKAIRGRTAGIVGGIIGAAGITVFTITLVF